MSEVRVRMTEAECLMVARTAMVQVIRSVTGGIADAVRKGEVPPEDWEFMLYKMAQEIEDFSESEFREMFAEALSKFTPTATVKWAS